MAQGKLKPLSRKGHKWGEAIKSEPWGSKSVSWQEIKSSFPAGWDPETAIKKTVAACKRHGLIESTENNLSDADCERIRKQEWNRRNNEKRHL